MDSGYFMFFLYGRSDKVYFRHPWAPIHSGIQILMDLEATYEEAGRLCVDLEALMESLTLLLQQDVALVRGG